MNIIGVAMLILPSMPRPDDLREAAALAYGVPSRDVAVGDYWDGGNAFPVGRRVYLNVWNEAYGGDLPVLYDQMIDASLADGIEASTQRIANRLGMMVVTNDLEGEAAFIHLPDGRTERRFLRELPEGGLLLPADLKPVALRERQVRAA
ncbi:MAG: hypothetical protein QM753_10865 [Thermomicrobiales bacterium]